MLEAHQGRLIEGQHDMNAHLRILASKLPAQVGLIKSSVTDHADKGGKHRHAYCAVQHNRPTGAKAKSALVMEKAQRGSGIKRSDGRLYLLIQINSRGWFKCSLVIVPESNFTETLLFRLLGLARPHSFKGFHIQSELSHLFLLSSLHGKYLRRQRLNGLSRDYNTRPQDASYIPSATNPQLGSQHNP